MSIVKRLGRSRIVQAALVRILAGYVQLCWVTTRWTWDGLDELKAELSEGPVIMVLWHERLIYAPKAFPVREYPICSLTSAAWAGRLAADVLRYFGFVSVGMESARSNLAASREVIRQARKGVSIGIAADGPEGPRRHLKSVPIEWARATRLPVWYYTYSVGAFGQARAWDRMILPRPFSTGRVAFRKWNVEIPRKATPEEVETLRVELEAAVNALSDEAADAAGHRRPD